MTICSVLRVFLLDDDYLMRHEFERQLAGNPEFQVVGSAETVAEARALLRHTAIDVAVVDLGLPDGSGTEIIAALRKSQPNVAILVSTIFGDESSVIRAIECGANGYLLKDADFSSITESIRSVCNGDAPLSPAVARHILKRFTIAGANAVRGNDRNAPAPPPLRRREIGKTPDSACSKAGKVDLLTARETDIVSLIAHGFSVAETAGKLNISYHTATSHIKNIYTKLFVHNRIDAVNEARRRGLID